ncbi:MAG: MoaD/ThiS family protein [Bacteroidota bacterium]
MRIKLLAFGIARDIIGGTEKDFNWTGEATVGGLKEALLKEFPAFVDLASLRIAVNEAYAEDETPISTSDEIVLIPPVSGG